MAAVDQASPVCPTIQYNKFSDETKIARVRNCEEGSQSVQRDIDQLPKWAEN